MAKIPLPERGQPLDVTYIYSMVDAINSLSASIPSTTYKYLTLDIPGRPSETEKTSNAKIVLGYKQVTTTQTVKPGDTVSFDYDYADFKFPPIVTATPVHITGTVAGKNVSVVIDPPTTTKVTGLVRFYEGGDATVGVNLMIIGIPN
jgi:hypothetical protein